MIYDQRIDRVENELDTVKEILMVVARRYEEGAERQRQTDERIDGILGAIDRLKPLQEQTDERIDRIVGAIDRLGVRVDALAWILRLLSNL